jgi:hypothetical protein
VVIRPVSRPIASFSGLTSGARQLVVQEAFEITVSEAFSTSWLTPKTMVASTSLPPGAEMMTFLAPPFRWAEAFSLVVKKPVHSSTTSTPSSPHGISAGLRCANTRIWSPLTIMLSPSTVDGARELAVRGVVAGQVGVRLGIAQVVDATIWMSCFLPPS